MALTHPGTRISGDDALNPRAGGGFVATADDDSLVGWLPPAAPGADVYLVMPDGVGTDGQVLTSDGLGGVVWATPASGVTDHGALTGLSDDDHTQYALLAGRSGGQTLVGGPGASDTLAMSSPGGVYVGGSATGLSGAFNVYRADAGDVVAFRSDANGLVTFRNSGGVTQASIHCGNGAAVFAATTVGTITIGSGGVGITRGNAFRLNGSGDPNWGVDMTPSGAAYLDINTGSRPVRVVSRNGAIRTVGWQADPVAFETSQWANSSTTNRQVTSSVASMPVATDASRTGRLVHSVIDFGGTRETFREEATGSAAAIGFLGAAAVTRQTVTGSHGSNAALQSLLTALATLGLITDSTTA